MICDECGAVIPKNVADHRRRSAHHYCNRECRAIYEKEHGILKAMSKAGKAARSLAVAASNTKHPRRRRKLIESEVV